MDEPVSLDARIEALRRQIDELKRQQRDEQAELRQAIKARFDEMRAMPEEERRGRERALRDQIDVMKQQYREQQESQRAILGQINELKRLAREERRGRGESLREKLADKMVRAREEHERQHHAGRWPDLTFGEDPESRKGFLKIHILLSLSVRPAHGYELIHWIGQHTGHAWQPSPGSMYPALDALESKGFICCQGDGRRKVYSLTPKGQDVLVRMREKREEQFAEMKAFMSAVLDE